jgi:esterase
MNGRGHQRRQRTAQRTLRSGTRRPPEYTPDRPRRGEPGQDGGGRLVGTTNPADMTELAHFQIGDGPQALLLLHGFLGSGRNVTTLARELSKRDPALTLVVLDLTGHGGSPRLPPDADTATLARDVFETAGRLALAPPLRLVGHSLGGRVALRACLLDPAAVTHVTLLDIAPSPREDEGETTRVVKALISAPETGDSRETFRRHFRQTSLAKDLTDWLLLNLIREGESYRWRIDRGVLAALHPRIKAEDLWPAVEGPRGYSLHCIRGALSDYVSEDDARRLRSAGCPVDTVEGASHFLHVERPGEVAECILLGMGPSRIGPSGRVGREERGHGLDR